ncbi:MAG: hypothetical protein JWN52_5716 [Actinomycetia bacterium]|nr:hypothetical protein [Actinomycetes bacterium]
MLSASVEGFLADIHLVTLTTLRLGGSPHVEAVRFTWDSVARLARVKKRPIRSTRSDEFRRTGLRGGPTGCLSDDVGGGGGATFAECSDESIAVALAVGHLNESQCASSLLA